MRRLGGTLAEPEPLVEVERRAVERAQRDVAGPVHAASVERGAQHGIPRAERLVRLRIAVDPRADHETERGPPLVHEVGERVAVERDLQRRRVAAGNDLERPLAAAQRPHVAVDRDRERRQAEALRVGRGALAVARERVAPRAVPEVRRVDGRGCAHRAGAGVDARPGGVVGAGHRVRIRPCLCP